MVADSKTTIFDWAGIGMLTAACLPFAPAANAQNQTEIERCASNDSVTPDLQISGCTAVIQSNTFAGKDLAFAFNNRGLAHQSRGVSPGADMIISISAGIPRRRRRRNPSGSD
jgi:hypothetical protein